MRPMGDINYEADTFFSVISPQNVGAGVSIRSGGVRNRVYVKITVCHEDACNLTDPPAPAPVVAGAMLSLSTPFEIEVRTIVKRNQPALVFMREVFARADL